MADYKVLKVDDKNKDWKVISIEKGENEYLHNVSVNRVNKKGEVFPNFDDIKEGAITEGELWESGSSKWYLFAPKQKPARSPNGSFRDAQIEKIMDKKEASIEKFQGRKEESIKLAGAMRDAVLVSLASLRDQPFPTDEEYKAEFEKWLKYFLNIGEQPFV